MPWLLPLFNLLFASLRCVEVVVYDQVHAFP